MATGIEMMMKMAGLDPAAIIKQVSDIQSLVKDVDDRLTRIENVQTTILNILNQIQEKANGSQENSGTDASGQAGGINTIGITASGNAGSDPTDNRQLDQSAGSSAGSPQSPSPAGSGG